MSEQEIKRQLTEVWHQKVIKAERDYGIAVANAEKIQMERNLPPSSYSNFTLRQAVKLQKLAKDEYLVGRRIVTITNRNASISV